MLSADRKRRLRYLAGEVFGYGLASCVALAVDILTLKTLVDRGGWNYLNASIVAFTVGALVSYALSVRYVFRNRPVANRRLELVYFIVLGLAGLAVNSLALRVTVGIAGLGLVTGKLIAACCTFGANFTLRRSLLFAARGS